jgi:hypothetical protein
MFIPESGRWSYSCQYRGGISGGGCISPLILTFGTGWRWVVNFMPELLYARKKPWCLLSRRLGGPKSQSWHAREKKNLFLLLQLEAQVIQPVAQLQYRLCYTGFFYTRVSPYKVTETTASQNHSCMLCAALWSSRQTSLLLLVHSDV